MPLEQCTIQEAHFTQNCHWKTRWIIICRKDWVARLPQSNEHAPSWHLQVPVSANQSVNVSKINDHPGRLFWLCEQKTGFHSRGSWLPPPHLTGCSEGISPSTESRAQHQEKIFCQVADHNSVPGTRSQGQHSSEKKLYSFTCHTLPTPAKLNKPNATWQNDTWLQNSVRGLL